MAEKVIKTNHDYYGKTYEWCVTRLSMNDYIGKSGERDDSHTIVKFDFGRPYSERFDYKSEFLGNSRYDLERIIEVETKAVMEGGSREDIVDEVIKTINDNYECEISYKTFEKSSTWMSHFRLEIVKKGEGRFKDLEIAVADDIKPYLSDEDRNAEGTLTNVYYGTCKNSFYGRDAMAYMINKVLKDKYTYCIKMGKNIVPEEYLEDGEAGIERWKKEKSGSNKQNSIEKQMMKKLKYEKKQTAFNEFNNVIVAMCNERSSRDWGTAFLAVDGRWNTSRRLKTIQKHVLNGVSDDDLIKMSDEEIKKRCKSHWVFELQQAIERIKNL